MKVNYKRQVLYEGGRCHYCRLEFHKTPKSDFDPEKAATIEHLILRSQEHLIPKEYRGKFNTVLECYPKTRQLKQIVAVLGECYAVENNLRESLL